MANSAVIGTLRVLLTASTAEFEAALKTAGKQATDLGKGLSASLAGPLEGIGGLISSINPALRTAFTVAAIGKVTGDFVAMAGALVDLEAKTGLSVTALQKLKGATEQSGVALDTVAAASLQLSKRLGEGKDSTLGALTALGLKYEEIRALSPEDQFFAVADALGKVGDQNEKVALTNDLLGKQGNEILPALNGHLKETADAYEKMGLVMSEDVIRKGDELGDQWTVLKSVGSALVAQVLGPLIPALASVTAGLVAAAPAIGAVAKGFFTLIGYPFKVALVDPLNAVAAAFDHVVVAARGMGALPDIKVPTLAVPTPGGPPKLTPDDFKAIDAQLTDSAKQRMKENQDAIKAVGDRTAALRQFYDWLGEREIEDVDRQQRALEQEQALWRDYYNWLGERRMEDDAAAEKSRQQQVFAASATMGEAKGGWELHPPVAEVRSAGAGLGTLLMGGMGDTFKTQLGPTIMAAVTGGGKVLESVGSLIGGSFTSGLAKMFKLAGPWGDLVAGLGTLLGPLLGKLFGGVSPEIKKSRTELEGFQKDLRGNLTETQKQEAGTEGWKMDVIAVRDAYLATGRTADEAMAIVKQMWDTDHPAQSKAAIEAINRVLEEQGRIAADNEAAAAAATQAQQDAAEARAQELDDLKGKLADLKDQATVDWNDMAAAAKKYGIDVDSLGPKFQGERIAAGAQDIVDTFDMLTENGASVGGVLFGMREEINALVKDALKFGTELPANMKPWIDELVRSGNLVDENGAALTDVSKLQFGAPVESKLDRVNTEIEQVTKKIEELTSKIGDDLVAAFDKLPTEIPIKVTFTVPDLNLPGAGDVRIQPVPLAGGGIVTAPTLALIGEGRSPEAVIPLDRLRDTGARGGIVVLPFIPMTDPYLAAEEAARQFKRRVGGDSHGMRAVLEQVIDDWMRTYGDR